MNEKENSRGRTRALHVALASDSKLVGTKPGALAHAETLDSPTTATTNHRGPSLLATLSAVI